MMTAVPLGRDPLQCPSVRDLPALKCPDLCFRESVAGETHGPHVNVIGDSPYCLQSNGIPNKTA